MPVTDPGQVHTGGWTAVERASVTELRWWDVDELANTTETVYPPALPDLVQALLVNGWDGTTLTISAHGPDEEAAIAALCGLVEAGFGEEQWNA